MTQGNRANFFRRLILLDCDSYGKAKDVEGLTGKFLNRSTL